MMRRAFSLIELTVVVALMGILVAIAFPFVRDGASRAKAANLVELTHVTKAAYIEAGEPPASQLTSPLGQVPALLGKTLTAGSFQTEDSVTMHVSGVGRQVYLVMRGTSPAARRVLAMFHLEELEPHTFLSGGQQTVVMVPLGEAAVVVVGAGTSNGGGTPPPSKPPVATPSQVTPNPQPQQPQVQPQLPQPPQQQPPPQTQPPAQTRPPAQTQPPAQSQRPTQSQPQSPTCSASLNPGQYRQCVSASSGPGNQHHGQGWFRNPH